MTLSLFEAKQGGGIMEESLARVIEYPGSAAQTASPRPEEETSDSRRAVEGREGDFLDRLARGGAGEERLYLELKRISKQVEALRAGNRWEEVVDLLHPAEEKAPELAEAGLAGYLRSEAAFALGHLARFDEAIALYQRCLEDEPDDFRLNAGLAYTAYDSLYAAKGRRIALHPAERKLRIELAHRHFAAAQALRPRGVANYYRQGMLYKQIENKREKAMPLFETAVRNWESLSDEEKGNREKDRKNYVKSLYQLASCQLDANRPSRALESLRKCLEEDEGVGTYSAVHKYFALGKVHYHAGSLKKALEALETAAVRGDPAEDDYVFELQARVHLAAGDPAKAWEAVSRVPLKRRRPYVRWTEGDILLELGDADGARRVLREAAGKDRRGRHKALMRLARLEFRLDRYEECLDCSVQADEFFRGCYKAPCQDGLFWKAAALFRLGRIPEAAEAAEELDKVRPNYPHLQRLRQFIASAS